MEEYLQTKGRIFNIQRFSIHDGPGIRTIVFLKGCPYRCRWCCNPESQEYAMQTLIENGKEKSVGKDVTAAEVLETVERDRIYYRRSKGGMTLSGGECLAQPDFALALLKGAHDRGIPTCIETAGGIPQKNLAQVLPYLDVCLMDIKHMNPEKHREYIGVTNERTLENAVFAAKNAKKLIIRVPVVPGFNDTPEEIRDIAAFVKELGSVKEMHLLPYHRLGQDKYTGLSRPYPMGELLPPDKDRMNLLLNEVIKAGLRGQIGG